MVHWTSFHCRSYTQARIPAPEKAKAPEGALHPTTEAVGGVVTG
jgi:hypothetical protein